MCPFLCSRWGCKSLPCPGFPHWVFFCEPLYLVWMVSVLVWVLITFSLLGSGEVYLVWCFKSLSPYMVGGLAEWPEWRKAAHITAVRNKESQGRSQEEKDTLPGHSHRDLSLLDHSQQDSISPQEVSCRSQNLSTYTNETLGHFRPT